MLQQTFQNFSLFHLFICFLHDFAYKEFVKLLELTLKGAKNEILWYIFACPEDGFLCAAEFSLCCSDA